MDYSGGVGTPIWQGRCRKDADGLVLCVGYLYSGVGGKGGGIRLHIAEFGKQFTPLGGGAYQSVVVTEVGR